MFYDFSIKIDDFGKLTMIYINHYYLFQKLKRLRFISLTLIWVGNKTEKLEINPEIKNYSSSLSLIIIIIWCGEISFRSRNQFSPLIIWNLKLKFGAHLIQFSLFFCDILIEEQMLKCVLNRRLWKPDWF